MKRLIAVLLIVGAGMLAGYCVAGVQIDYVDKSRLNPSTDTLAKIDKAVALVMLDEINLLRVRAGLAARTPAQLRAAVTAKFRSLP